MLRAARWIVNVFVLTLLLPVFARAAGTRVTGQVVDAETLAPIAGGEIELQNSGGGPGVHRAHRDANDRGCDVLATGFQDFAQADQIIELLSRD